jgi:hypothetical protein
LKRGRSLVVVWTSAQNDEYKSGRQPATGAGDAAAKTAADDADAAGTGRDDADAAAGTGPRRRPPLKRRMEKLT